MRSRSLTRLPSDLRRISTLDHPNDGEALGRLTQAVAGRLRSLGARLWTPELSPAPSAWPTTYEPTDERAEVGRLHNLMRASLTAH